MELKLIQIGTSTGVAIPSGALKLLGAKKGDKIEIEIKKVIKK